MHTTQAQPLKSLAHTCHKILGHISSPSSELDPYTPLGHYQIAYASRKAC